MAPETKTQLSILTLGKVLLKIQNGESLDTIINQLSAPEMKKLRNFLESEAIYLSSLLDDSLLGLSQIKSNYEPVPNYYYKQDCREPLESCLNETCLGSNPVCFSQKMKLQIEALIKLVTPYLEKQ
ncbi:MAG: hypothetical protein Kow0042_13530 [Calditrichia bacterium]